MQDTSMVIVDELKLIVDRHCGQQRPSETCREAAKESHSEATDQDILESSRSLLLSVK